MSGCGDSGLGSCDKQPDVSGQWTLALTPASIDGGVPEIPRADTIVAQLVQVKPPGVLSLGRLIEGTLVSSDKGFFDTLIIPPLMMNDGSKTGSLLGCELSINVPVEGNVSDDDVDQGPLRIALTGTITGRGAMQGIMHLSSTILSDDATAMPRSFLWTATQP